MKRIATVLGCCLILAPACGGSGGSIPEDRSVEDEYVGGWDAEGSDGAAILLLREGLLGTLNITSLSGRQQRFHFIFDVEGQMEEEDLQLSLNCAEARAQDLTSDEPEPEPEPEPDAGSEPEPDTTGEGDAATRDDDVVEDAEAQWLSMDCSGWDLELACSLAGECDSGDCNMVCDVVFFGDAYAHSEVELGRVEDAFDYWQRV